METEVRTFEKKMTSEYRWGLKMYREKIMEPLTEMAFDLFDILKEKKFECESLINNALLMNEKTFYSTVADMCKEANVDTRGLSSDEIPNGLTFVFLNNFKPKFIVIVDNTIEDDVINMVHMLEFETTLQLHLV